MGCRPVEERYSRRAKRVKTFSDCNLHDLQSAQSASRATESGKPRDAFQAIEGRSPIEAYICWDVVRPRGTYGGEGFSAVMTNEEPDGRSRQKRGGREGRRGESKPTAHWRDDAVRVGFSP